MNSKVLTLLGFASKAGALIFGAASVTDALKGRRVKGVFYAENISQKSRKEIIFHCDKAGIKAYELKGIDMDMLSAAVGRSCGVLALTDQSFLTPIVSNLTSDI